MSHTAVSRTMSRTASHSLAQAPAKENAAVRPPQVRSPQVRPLIAIQTNRRTYKGTFLHGVDEYYIGAIEQIAGGDICLVPCLDAPQLETLLARVDGVLLTGGLTNVHPKHYGIAGDASYQPFDGAREQTGFHLVREAKARGLPLLAICLGMQELNVALGGSLQNNIQDKPGHLPHRDNHDKNPRLRYGARHCVTPVPDGRLAKLLGSEPFRVNSLHQQAVERLADSLRPEARAEDGILEAVSLKDSAQFFFGIQWHPEYQAKDNPQSRKLFAALGDAARRYAASPAATKARACRARLKKAAR